MEKKENNISIAIGYDKPTYKPDIKVTDEMTEATAFDQDIILDEDDEEI
nr:MAG TPA: hypothetical protein [Caudoviricetes sp.]